MTRTQPFDLAYDEGLINTVATQFDLRAPNRAALDATVTRIAHGDFDPQNPLVINLATGVGKTYAMAALIEYLRLCGHHNIMIVTPNLVIQTKTVANLSRDNRKYIDGFDVPPRVYTPGNTRGATRNAGQLALPDSFTGSDVFVFNVQTLLAPKKTNQPTLGTSQEAQKARIRRFNENDGNVYAYLQSLDDLVVIADESHLYGREAKAFNAALKELDPAVTIGLTASAPSDADIVYRYPLYEAITDGLVKRPVIVCRATDYSEYTDGEERQLRDGLAVLRSKAADYRRYALEHPDMPGVHPVMLVTCADIDHATTVSSLLAGPGYVGDPTRVLQVDSQHNDDETLRRLDAIDTPDSTVEAVVSVGKLREGWDASNVAVIVSLRAMASEVLTQQTMGRGLRLPFKSYTGVDTIDQLDIIAHKSYIRYLESEDALEVFGVDKVVTSLTSAGEVSPAPTESSVGTGDTAPRGVGSPVREEGAVIRDGAGEYSTVVRGEEVAGGVARPVVGVHVLDEGETIPEPSPVPDPVVVRINEKFAGETFLFPSSTMATRVGDFSLAAVTDEQVRTAVAKVNPEGVYLDRQKVDARDGKIRLTRTTRVQGGIDAVPDVEVERQLTQEAVGTQTFAQTASNLRILKSRIISPFLESVGRARWSETALASARHEIRNLLTGAKKAFVASNTTLAPEITPVTLPVASSYPLPPGITVHDVEEPSKLTGVFRREFHYGPWSGSSLFTAAQFDSLSAEYTLAYMLDVDPDVLWWKRLYPEDRARFAWSGGDRFYNPDFVVRDTDGNYWIVEAKASSKIDDAEVRDKRDAAEMVMRELTGDDRFAAVQWGYVLASEADIAAVSTWKGLCARTHPITS